MCDLMDKKHTLKKKREGRGKRVKGRESDRERDKRREKVRRYRERERK